MKPPPVLAPKRRMAVSMSAGEISSRLIITGSGITRYWRTSPPIGMTWATPGMVRICGRITKSAISRSSMGETDAPVTATSMISPMIEEIGPICGCTPCGSRPCTVRQPLRDLLPGAIDLGVPAELDVDDRQADAGGRADAHHAGHAAHGRLDRVGDELLDLLRRQPLGLGEQHHGGAVEVGEYVDRKPRQHEAAVGHENESGS